MSTPAPDTASASGRRQEDAHLREIESQVRAYINDYFDPHNEKHDRTFAPGTVRFVEGVRPVLDQLDAVRTRRVKKA